MVLDDLGRILRGWGYRRRLRRVAPRAVARQAGRRLNRLFLLERRQALAPRGAAMLRGWKRIHIPFSIVLCVTTVIHVVTALEFAT